MPLQADFKPIHGLAQAGLPQWANRPSRGRESPPATLRPNRLSQEPDQPGATGTGAEMAAASRNTQSRPCKTWSWHPPRVHAPRPPDGDCRQNIFKIRCIVGAAHGKHDLAEGRRPHLPPGRQKRLEPNRHVTAVMDLGRLGQQGRGGPFRLVALVAGLSRPLDAAAPPRSPPTTAGSARARIWSARCWDPRSRSARATEASHGWPAAKPAAADGAIARQPQAGAPPCRRGPAGRCRAPAALPPSRPDPPRCGRPPDAARHGRGTSRPARHSAPPAPPPAGRAPASRHRHRRTCAEQFGIAAKISATCAHSAAASARKP